LPDSWTDFFGVAFFASAVSDLRLTFTSGVVAASDFTALLPFLTGVRAGDFDRFGDGLLDFVWPRAGDFDFARPLCSYPKYHND